MNTVKDVRVLVVEDEPDTAKMISALLERNFPVRTEVAPDLSSALERLSTDVFDLVTLDHQLPDGDGLKLLEETRRSPVNPAVIIVTGQGSEWLASEAWRLGASAYIVKDPAGFAPELVTAVRNALEKRALDLAESELKKFRMAVEQSMDGMAVTDLEGYIEFANRAWSLMHGRGRENLSGKHMRLFHTVEQHKDDVAPFIEQVLLAGLNQRELGHTRKDGREFPTLTTAALLQDERDNPAGIVWIAHDITEQKVRERDLIASKDMWDRSFQGISTGMFIIDRDFKILRCNRAFAQLLGKDPGEIIGRRCCEVVHGLGHSPDWCATCASVSRRISVREEFWEPSLGKHLEISADPVLDPEGNLEYAIHAINDISERKKAETDREGLLHDLGERNKELNCLYGLSKLVEKPGITLEEILEGLVDIIPPSWQYPDITGAKVLLGEREYKTNNYRETDWIQIADIIAGGEREGTLHVCYLEEMPDSYEGPFLTEERNLIDMLAERLGRIIERKRTEGELQKINVELESFAHTVSHDLNGPLSAIKMAVNLLAESTGGDRVEVAGLTTDEITGIIDSNTDKAIALTADLLSLAEAGQVPDTLADVRVSEVVRDILDVNAVSIKEGMIAVRFDDDLGQIRASRAHIYQLLSNLIVNAIHHNDSASLVIEVVRLGDGDDGSHHYLVRDSGSGIPPENLEKVFTPFFKGENGQTGIGLSTVKKIVEVYGGEIKAYNDGGACFEFVLRDFK